MQICKAPTLRLKTLNKHTHIMYIEMENVIQKKIKKRRKKMYVSTNVQVLLCKRCTHTHSHTHTHTHARTHARTHAHTRTLYRLIGVKDNVI